MSEKLCRCGHQGGEPVILPNPETGLCMYPVSKHLHPAPFSSVWLFVPLEIRGCHVDFLAQSKDPRDTPEAMAVAVDKWLEARR